MAENVFEGWRLASNLKDFGVSIPSHPVWNTGSVNDPICRRQDTSCSDPIDGGPGLCLERHYRGIEGNGLRGIFQRLCNRKGTGGQASFFHLYCVAGRRTGEERTICLKFSPAKQRMGKRKLEEGDDTVICCGDGERGFHVLIRYKIRIPTPFLASINERLLHLPLWRKVLSLYCFAFWLGSLAIMVYKDNAQIFETNARALELQSNTLYRRLFGCTSMSRKTVHRVRCKNRTKETRQADASHRHSEEVGQGRLERWKKHRPPRFPLGQQPDVRLCVGQKSNRYSGARTPYAITGSPKLTTAIRRGPKKLLWNCCLALIGSSTPPILNSFVVFRHVEGGINSSCNGQAAGEGGAAREVLRSGWQSAPLRAEKSSAPGGSSLRSARPLRCGLCARSARPGESTRYTGAVRLSSQSLRDLKWWRSLTRGEGRELQPVQPHLTMHTDASDIGFGGDAWFQYGRWIAGL